MTRLTTQRQAQRFQVHRFHTGLGRRPFTRLGVSSFLRTLEVGYTLRIDIGVVRLNTEAIPRCRQHIVELLIRNLEAFKLTVAATAGGGVLNILANTSAGVEVALGKRTRNKEVLQVLVEHAHGQRAHRSKIPLQRRVKLSGLHGCQRDVTAATNPLNRRYGGNIAALIDRRIRIHLFRLVSIDVLDLNLTRTNYGLLTHFGHIRPGDGLRDRKASNPVIGQINPQVEAGQPFLKRSAGIHHIGVIITKCTLIRSQPVSGLARVTQLTNHRILPLLPVVVEGVFVAFIGAHLLLGPSADRITIGEVGGSALRNTGGYQVRENYRAKPDAFQLNVAHTEVTRVVQTKKFAFKVQAHIGGGILLGGVIHLRRAEVGTGNHIRAILIGLKDTIGVRVVLRQLITINGTTQQRRFREQEAIAGDAGDVTAVEIGPVLPLILIAQLILRSLFGQPHGVIWLSPFGTNMAPVPGSIAHNLLAISITYARLYLGKERRVIQMMGGVKAVGTQLTLGALVVVHSRTPPVVIRVLEVPVRTYHLRIPRRSFENIAVIELTATTVPRLDNGQPRLAATGFKILLSENTQSHLHVVIAGGGVNKLDIGFKVPAVVRAPLKVETQIVGNAASIVVTGIRLKLLSIILALRSGSVAHTTPPPAVSNITSLEHALITPGKLGIIRVGTSAARLTIWIIIIIVTALVFKGVLGPGQTRIGAQKLGRHFHSAVGTGPLARRGKALAHPVVLFGEEVGAVGHPDAAILTNPDMLRRVEIVGIIENVSVALDTVRFGVEL